MASNRVLTNLFDSIRSISLPKDNPNHANVSHHLILGLLPEGQKQSVKSVLLTLHFLFPHEMLPALDLLDRRLLTCLVNDANRDKDEVYYVQSASATAPRSGRHRNAMPPTDGHYEVHLQAWNCTCPAFAYSSIKLLMQAHEQVESDGTVATNVDWQEIDHNTETSWRFGGVGTKPGSAVPVCKHILAVALCCAAPGVFGAAIAKKGASPEEHAAWAAGWSDQR